MCRAVLFIVLFISFLASTTLAGTYIGGEQQLSPDYILSWTITPSTGPYPPVVTFTATINATGWIGLGFHELNTNYTAMPHADFLIAEFDGSTGRILNVTDRFATTQNGGFAMPVLDVTVGGQENILNFSGYQTTSPNALSTFTASRFVKTGDRAADHVLSPGSIQVIWAHGNLASSDPNKFAYHGFGDSHRGIVHIDFFAAN